MAAGATGTGTGDEPTETAFGVATTATGAAECSTTHSGQ